MASSNYAGYDGTGGSGMMSPGWQALQQSLQGRNVNFGTLGSRRPIASPTAALRGASSYGGGPSQTYYGGSEDEAKDFDATDYQVKRKAYTDSLDASQQADIDRMKDTDPYNIPTGMMQARNLANEQRTQAGLDQAAADQRAIASFGRTEALRMNQQGEAVRNAAAMLPFNPAYQQSNLKYLGAVDTNDARRDVATTTARGRLSAGALAALARAASAPTFNDEDRKTLQDAIGLITPNVPQGQQTPQAGPPPPAGGAEKVFPKEALDDFVREMGGQAQAMAALRAGGYTIR